jgi:aryl-alcohol dehydrogenase-like predicted oxidoreductase
MIHHRLKGTELDVSRVCLGTMTFGGQVDEALALR